MEEKIGSFVCVSSSAVHNWVQGENGPDNIDIIIKLAEFFNIKFELLLKNMDAEKKKDNLNNRQLDAIKRIYDEIISFLHEFQNTDGFNSLWYEYYDSGESDPEEKIYEYIDKKLEKVFLAFDKEYFDLHDLAVYNEIENYINNDLYDTFDGKVSYGYRFEADGVNQPTTRDDFLNALKSINSIIEKYCF